MDNNSKIDFRTVIAQKVGLDAADMDGEIVMMDINKGKYYCFNSVGSRIWQLLEKPTSIKEVILTLLKEFDVDDKTCEETVLDFINRIYYEELISVV